MDAPSNSNGNIDSGSRGPGDLDAGLSAGTDNLLDLALGLSPRGVPLAWRAALNKKSSGVDSLLLGDSCCVGTGVD